MMHIHKLKIRYIILGLIIVFTTTDLNAQRFTRVDGLWSRLQGSQIQLMDFDRDNDYDICAWGVYSTPGGNTSELVVYRNNGNGEYDSILVNPDGIYISPEGLIGTADINRDNIPELVAIAAENSSLRFIQNTGGDFTGVRHDFNVAGVGPLGVSLADFDNDGSEEILRGLSVHDPYKDLYGYLEFNNVYEEWTRWIDMNNDGMADILRIHREQYVDPSSSFVCINNGTSFDESPFSYNENRPRDIITGDYDNDGFEDIVIFSYLVSNYITFAELFRNNGNGNFEYVRDITKATGGRFTDLDNDGDMDLVFVGHNDTSGSSLMEYFLNNGSGDFELVQTEQIRTWETSLIYAGDYDGDGDNDVLLSDAGGSTGMTVLQNMLVEDQPSKANAAPAAPSNLRSEVNFNRVRLSWDPSTDAETPSAALSYNVYISRENQAYSASPNADTLTGFRYVPGKGNAGFKCFYDIRCMEDGNYSWSVQAVDNSGRASDFAASGTFAVIGTVPGIPGPLVALPAGHSRVELQWNDNYQSEDGFIIERYLDSIPGFRPAGFYEIRRVGADSTSCIIEGLEAKTEYIFRVLAYNCSASSPCTPADTVKTYPLQFTKKMILDYTSGHQAEWADFDRDGDMDILMVYERESGSYDIRYTGIMVNETDTLIETELALRPIYSGYLNFGSANWFDFDSDGLNDILLVRCDQLKPKMWVYKNNGDNTFRNIMCDSLLTIDPFRRAPSFADYDNDGDPDILITGKNQTTNATEAVIYENENNGRFKPVLIQNMTGIVKSRMPWCDFNNDGYIDFLANEPKPDHTAYLSVYKNNGDRTFTRINYENLAGLNEYDANNGDMRWGDCNSDGFADIIISGGHTGSDGWGITRVYMNNGNETFTDTGPAGIWSLHGNVSLEWGDFNNDGLPDILHAGTHNVDGEAYKTRIFYNSNSTFVKGEYDSFLPIGQLSMSTAADSDNDGDLDVLVQGQNPISHPQIALYLNFQPVSNSRPETPSGLTEEYAGNEVILRWNRASDRETPAAGLTYNVCLLSVTDTIISPSALESGRRTVVGTGNAGYNNFLKIKNLRTGTYTWSVQSIDNCYEGSSFTILKTFSHVNTGVTQAEESGLPGLELFPNPVSDRMTISVQNSAGSKCRIVISDISGRQLKTIQEAELPFETGTGFLEPGVYVVTVILDGIRLESRLLKI